MKFFSRIPYKILLIGPAVSFALGYAMNKTVLALNHGMMPVLDPGGCDPADFIGDTVHVCMQAGTHLNALADWVVMHSNGSVGVASPGDLFIWLHQYAFWPCLVAWAALMVRDRQARTLRIS